MLAIHAPISRARSGGTGTNCRFHLSLSRQSDRVPLLAVLQSFVDSELSSLEILHAQHENLRWPQAADGENPQYQMLSRAMRGRAENEIHQTLRKRSHDFVWIFGMASFRAGLFRIRSSSAAYSKHDLR